MAEKEILCVRIKPIQLQENTMLPTWKSEFTSDEAHFFFDQSKEQLCSNLLFKKLTNASAEMSNSVNMEGN